MSTPPGQLSKRQLIATALITMGAGFAGLVIAIVEAFRYSPYGDPAAGAVALNLGILSLLTMAAPIVVALCRAIAASHRRYSAWKKTLTPEERFAVDAAEVAALLGAHIAWRNHNREVQARLTDSVMGNTRKIVPHEMRDQFAWDPSIRAYRRR